MYAHTCGRFNIADADNSGTISTLELQTYLVAKGRFLSQADVENKIKKIDEQPDGFLDFQEFMAMSILIFGIHTIRQVMPMLTHRCMCACECN